MTIGQQPEMTNLFIDELGILILGVRKRLPILTNPCSSHVQVYLSMCDLFATTRQFVFVHVFVLKCSCYMFLIV